MSDYQKAKLVSIEGKNVLLEVQETSDVDVLHRLAPAGEIQDEEALRTWIAMILCEFEGGDQYPRDNSMTRTILEEERMEANQIISSVRVESMEESAKNHADVPLYRGVFKVQVAVPEMVEGFVPAEWGCAAEPDGDLDDYFG